MSAQDASTKMLLSGNTRLYALVRVGLGDVRVSSEVRTWHHGLVAQWWAEFNQGGDDVEHFRRAIAGSGEPALDVACGTGRVLVPLRRAGVDVDGSDVSADMLAWCRRAADAEGLRVSLYQQPVHALELPRRYRTVFICGAFGLGGT